MKAAWVLAAFALLCAAEAGSSLRGAVEALQRRQRGHSRGPTVPNDYDALYEFVPPPYPEPDYAADIEDLQDEETPRYVVKIFGENDSPPDAYEYKIIKKKNIHIEPKPRKESAFRERSHHSDNDRLKDLFGEKNEEEGKNDVFQDKSENDSEYALLLGQLWSKYKNKKHPKNLENTPQGVVKLYTEKIVKKRYPDSWGPISYKRKRSSDVDADRPIAPDYDERKLSESSSSTYNAYEGPEEDKDDWREEYAIAFQPLDDDLTDLSEDDQYAYDTVEKRFPVTKRSSGPFEINNQKKRFAQNKRAKSKTFRSSAGTDPRIIKDLSKIFGDADLEIIKSPVKRSADQDSDEHSHEVKPPKVPGHSQNSTHEGHNSTDHNEGSHEQHGHNIHHPGISGKEVEVDAPHPHDAHHKTDKPIVVRKKSIDWSDYFGIDKRAENFVNNMNQDRLRKQYFDTFNKEVLYPLNSFRKHNTVKRNYVQTKPSERPEAQSTQSVALADDEKNIKGSDESKLDNIDHKLKTMEGMIVDEALHLSDVGEELDSKEEQEKKEIILSRLAAAYSLEKMRKALKEFKQSLKSQRKEKSGGDEVKAKRVAVKKEKVEMNNNEIPSKDINAEDFEEEQGAGQYVNGKNEQQYSEGYMGSGRHRTPVISTVGAAGSCPVLARIVQRCHGVDMLAGDRGQLFLPLCSLHQICYLCGEAPPTTCDLLFLSEADTTCDGDMGCQRAARSALMALRELHDNLADELDGECEASPCLPATLKLNKAWQKALQR